MQLFKTPDGKPVYTIGGSTIARYYWCSPQAWLSASGIQAPQSEALSTGTKIHADIEEARKLSPQEEEFQHFLSQFLTEDKRGKNIGRPWLDGKTKLVDDIGWIATHGLDDFKIDNQRRVTNIEYKSKKGWRVDPVSLMPALFQTKVYMYIYEPYLILGGWYWKESWVVWLKRTRDGFEPIGETRVDDYDSAETQRKIADIFDEWNRASEAKTNAERRRILIPPKKFKCRICPEVYKTSCPFQQ
ncbi:MAG: hypothetical protein OEY30_02875 [Candidatus Bathyarchaeota archaeon]|nr:hypothetical protein [Candidatus Bathyarchaeota archaeon]